jgi:hypothetical protein
VWRDVANLTTTPKGIPSVVIALQYPYYQTGLVALTLDRSMHLVCTYNTAKCILLFEQTNAFRFRMVQHEHPRSAHEPETADHLCGH